MDFNPSDVETSEHMIIWSHGFDKNPVETKSFKCTFCERGFSNAQALGGHMNIHRKDRAKLKELSLDVDRKHSPPPDSSAGKRLSSENDESPCDVVEENPDRGSPCFAEAERGRFDKQVEGAGKLESDYGELDLELRLGPEPRHANSKP